LLAQAIGKHLIDLLNGKNPAQRTARIDKERLSDQRAWDALPVLTPRFKALFGTGTRWPKGWGPEPEDKSAVLDGNYKLQKELIPENACDI
jgi:hypothetical protein